MWYKQHFESHCTIHKTIPGQGLEHLRTELNHSRRKTHVDESAVFGLLFHSAFFGRNFKLEAEMVNRYAILSCEVLRDS